MTVANVTLFFFVIHMLPNLRELYTDYSTFEAKQILALRAIYTGRALKTLSHIFFSFFVVEKCQKL